MDRDSQSTQGVEKTRGLLILVLLVLALVVGPYYIYGTWRDYTAIRQADAIEQATTLSTFFSADLIYPLRGDATQTDAHSSLKNLVEKSGIVARAYIYTKTNDGDLARLATSEGEGSDLFFAIRENIDDAPFEAALLTDQPLIFGPITDNDEQYMGVLMPLSNDAVGDNVAVLGLEYTQAAWATDINRHIWHATTVTVLFWGVLGALAIAYRRYSDKKTLSKYVRQREEFYSKVFQQIPVGIAIMKDYRAVSAVNPTYLKILGRTEEQISELQWTEITHPDDLDRDLELFGQFKRGENDGYQMEKRYLRPDGSCIWVYMIIVGVALAGEKNVYHLCILQDIQERKNTEDALNETERSKSVLLSHLPGMAYRCKCDRAWTMTFVSDGCLPLTGYTSEELIYNRDITFNDIIVPEYREAIWDEWQNRLAVNAPFRGEYAINAKDGERKWVLELGQGVLDEKGELQALEGIIIDMTESKKKEARIQYLSDHDFLTGLFNRQYFDKKLRELDKKTYLPLTVFVCDVNGVRMINDAFGHSQGDRVIMEAARLLRGVCRKKDVLARTGGNEFTLLLPSTDEKQALSFYERIKNMIEQINRENKIKAIELSLAVGFTTRTSTKDSIEQTVKVAHDYMYNKKLLNRKSSHSAILSSIMATMYARSQETEQHAERLFELSKIIAMRLGLPQQTLDELEVFAMLHDIGKVGIADMILNKPGKLNEEEWAVIRRHPEIGYRIAKSSPELEHVAEYILTHHERWDGKGYPRGLKGEQIPLLSRILAVADAYDAMTQDRIYRKALPKASAIQEIKDNIGTQFDPAIVRLFLKNINDFDQ